MDSKSVFLNYKLYINFTNIISYLLVLIPINILFNLGNYFSFSLLAILMGITMLILYPLMSRTKKGDIPLTKEELKYYKDIQKENEKRLNNK